MFDRIRLLWQILFFKKPKRQNIPYSQIDGFDIQILPEHMYVQWVQYKTTYMQIGFLAEYGVSGGLIIWELDISEVIEDRVEFLRDFDKWARLNEFNYSVVVNAHRINRNFD